MSDRLPFHVFVRQLPKLPLRFILISQFAILIVGISGLMSWLSWRSEQETMTSLVGQLQNEISDRIQQKLTTYLETPHLINKINADAVKQGILKTEGKASEIYLSQQIQKFSTVGQIYYGGAKAGEFIGISRLEPDKALELAININGFQSYSYSLDLQGNRLTQKGNPVFYNAHQRPWYQAALTIPRPIWSPIYEDFELAELVITASFAVYNSSGESLGVLGSDLYLGSISQFLGGLKIGKSGQAFIIEPSGLLVASSTSEKSYQMINNLTKTKRLPIKNSSQPMILEAARQIEQRIGGLEQIKTTQNLEFWDEGKHIFLKVMPYRDDFGLNWLIVVMMPASDFTGQLEIKRQQTLVLTYLALGIAISLGLFTTQYINRALRRLSLASQSLANGELEREVPSSKIDELDILSQSFNQMARHLKQSFSEIENTNKNLELSIQARKVALLLSEEKFKSLVANIPGIVYRRVFDRIWTMAFLGGAVNELTGFLPEDFIGNQTRSWSSIIHPDDQTMVELAITNGLACRQSYIVEFRILDVQGNIRWFYEKGQGVFTEDDQLLWIDGAIFDISDRKQAESELLDRVHLSILIAEIGFASTQLNTLEDLIQSCVESLWRHIKCSFAQIWTLDNFGNVYIQSNVGNYSQSDADHLSNLLEKEKIWSIKDGNINPLFTDHILLNLSESDRVWLTSKGIVSLKGYPLIVKDRVVGGILLVDQDYLDIDIQSIDSTVTAIALGIDRKQSEEKLKSNNAEMKALFAAMDEAILVCDRFGTILKIPQTRRSLNWLVPDEVIGKNPAEIYSQEQSILFADRIQQVLDTKQTLSLEYSLITNNHCHWWNASISPIDAETVVWVARDITDLKQVEQQLKQSKLAAEDASFAKGQFLANMSHELRTPLNAILGFTQLMLRDRSLQDSLRSYLKIIYDSGEHLLELINDILDMTKIESGRTTLNFSSFDLHLLLDNLEKMFQLKATSKELQLAFNRLPSVPQWINTDEAKLRQILINLLNNAIKFTNIGSVTLLVDVIESFEVESESLNTKLSDIESTDSLSHIFLKFTVADTGAGICADDLLRIFEAFEQTDLGKQSSEGTGLGLSISRKFAHFMGGKILVNSQIGKGSVFELYLPANIPEGMVITRSSPDRYVIGLSPDQPEYRILVVEDRWESRCLLVKLLQAVGFHVKEAENGEEAIAVWDAWQPHLIWMDIRMPVMDGYEATRQIKSHLKSQPTVIIALTASALEEDKANILSAGCDDFVRKPFQEALILDKLAEHLGVRYLYEIESEIQSSDRQNIDFDELQYNLGIYLSQMPEVWVTHLHQAAMVADDELIAELIKDIPLDKPDLIQSLISLVDNYCYNQIMFIAQEVLKN